MTRTRSSGSTRPRRSTARRCPLPVAADSGSNAGAACLVVDFADLAYVSSAGLRVLLMGAKRLRASDGKLALCGMSPALHGIFKACCLEKLFTIARTREDALKLLR